MLSLSIESWFYSVPGLNSILWTVLIGVTSVLDGVRISDVIIVCLTLLQGRATLVRRKMYSEVDFLVSEHLAKSEFEYQTTSRLSTHL